MTDKTYIEIMYCFGEDLKRDASAEPYDPDEYNKVIDAINSTNRDWLRSLHRRNWLYIAIFVFYLSVTAWLVYEFLCYYEF